MWQHAPVDVSEEKPSQLDVAHDDAMTVAVRDRRQRLREQPRRLALRQSPLSAHVGVQVLARRVHACAVKHVRRRRADYDLGGRVNVRVRPDRRERQKYRVTAIKKQHLHRQVTQHVLQPTAGRTWFLECRNHHGYYHQQFTFSLINLFWSYSKFGSHPSKSDLSRVSGADFQWTKCPSSCATNSIKTLIGIVILQCYIKIVYAVRSFTFPTD